MMLLNMVGLSLTERERDYRTFTVGKSGTVNLSGVQSSVYVNNVAHTQSKSQVLKARKTTNCSLVSI